MKVTVVLCVLLAFTNALPAKNSERIPDPDEIIDSFFGFPRLPSWFGDSVSSSSSSSSSSIGGDSDDDDEMPIFSFSPIFVNPFASIFRNPFPSIFTDWTSPSSDPDTKITNSTSETKYINGHKMVINDTYYKNDKNGGVLRVHSVVVSDAKDKVETVTSKTETPAVTTTTEAPPLNKKIEDNEIRETVADYDGTTNVDDLQA